jgi:hypothetical protein
LRIHHETQTDEKARVKKGFSIFSRPRFSGRLALPMV